MMSMRKKAASSPAFSQHSVSSPRIAWRADGSPYIDLCPPTPQWGILPSNNGSTRPTVPDQAAGAQIAWAAYHGCSRRMNSACIANRAQSIAEQRLWWEETSSICRNAILLHNATLLKQYNAETAKHMELLEDAQRITHQMLQSLSSIQESPLEDINHTNPTTDNVALEINLFDEDPEPVKEHRTFGIFVMLEKIFSHITPKHSHIEIEKVSKYDAMLYD